VSGQAEEQPISDAKPSAGAMKLAKDIHRSFAEKGCGYYDDGSGDYLHCLDCDEMARQFDAFAAAHAPALPGDMELSEERSAHDKIASLCFAAGAESPDGTSIGAVKDLILKFQQAQAAATLSDLEAKIRTLEGQWRDVAAVQSSASANRLMLQFADSLKALLPPATKETADGSD
jgi:hypothetical protein